MNHVNKARRRPSRLVGWCAIIGVLAVAPGLASGQDGRQLPEVVPPGLNLDSGEPVTGEIVADVQITGHRDLTNDQIRQYIKTRPGRPFSPAMIADDIRSLNSTRMFIDVSTEYQRSGNNIVVIFRVAERPIINYVKFYGNKNRSDRQLQREAKLKVGEPLDPYSVDEAKNKLLEFYRGKGMADVHINVMEGLEPDDRGVVFVINEGSVQRIWNVEFTGNTIASDGRLKTRVQSEPPFLKIFGGYVSQDQIEADVQSLVSYYRDLGFRAARVGRELKYDEDREWLTLVFHIDEGPRSLVDRVVIEGITKFNVQEIAAQLKLGRSDYFDRTTFEQDIARIQEVYGTHGYIFSDVKPEIIEHQHDTGIDLVYRVEENQRYRVGRIEVQVRGANVHTHTRTVLNRMSLQPGDIVNIKQIRASERRLQASGLFVTGMGGGPQIIVQPISEEYDAESMADSGGGGFRGQSPDPRRDAVRAPREVAIELQPNRTGRPIPLWADQAAHRIPRPAAAAYRGQSPDNADGQNRVAYVDTPWRNEAEMRPKWKAPNVPMGASGDQQTQANLRRVANPMLLRQLRNDAQHGVPPRRPIGQTSAVGQALFAPANAANRTTTNKPWATSNARANDNSNNNATGSAGTNGRPVARWQSPGFNPNPNPPQYPQANFGGTGFAGSAYSSDTANQGGPPPANYYNSPTIQPGYGSSAIPATANPFSNGAQNPPVNGGIGQGAGTTFGAPPIPQPDNATGTAPQGGGLIFPDGGITPPAIDPTVKLVVPVEVTQTGRFNFGVGINSDAGVVGNIVLDETNFDISRYPRTVGEILDGRAFRGAGQHFRIEAVPGNQLQRYLVSFQEPYVFDSLFSFGVSGFFFDRRYDDWDEQRVGGTLSFGYQFQSRPDLSVSFTLRGENVNVRNPRLPVAPSVAAMLGDNEIWGAGVQLTHDTRNHSFLPTEGHLWQAGVEQVFGEYDYPRVNADVRQYFLLHQRPDRSGRHVVAVRGRMGITGNQTPAFEQFFAGGFSTLRGFDFRGASPVELTSRVGGEFMLLSSIEYLFPLTADDALRGVIFVDAGTVEESVKFVAKDFRVAPGIGLRISIPQMGSAPIALDFAYAVEKETTDDTQVFSFFVGFFR